jgi:hypothetical protein
VGLGASRAAACAMVSAIVVIEFDRSHPNAIMPITLRKGDAECIPNVASMLACGSPVRTLARPRSVAFHRVSSGWSLRKPSCFLRRKDRAARAEAGGRMPVGSIQKSPPFFPYVQIRTAHGPRSFHWNDTRLGPSKVTALGSSACHALRTRYSCIRRCLGNRIEIIF